MDDSVLGEAGRLLFPVEDWYWRGDTLGNLSYTWYTQLDARTSVDVVNRLRSDATEGEQVFYNSFALIYRSGAQTACEDLTRAMPSSTSMRAGLA